MPNGPTIRFCVLALTYDEYVAHRANLPRDIASLTNLDANLSSKGLIYGQDRDDWCPLETGKNVRQYLEEAGLSPVPLSNFIRDDLEDPGDWSSLVKEVDLYVFDPLFLTLDGSYSKLIDTLHGAIHLGQRNFCLVVPERFDPALRDHLKEICSKRLPLLERDYTKGLGEWGVGTADGLQHYFNSPGMKNRVGLWPLEEKKQDASLVIGTDGPSGIPGLGRRPN